MGQPEEFAEAGACLASEDASSATGTTWWLMEGCPSEAGAGEDLTTATERLVTSRGSWPPLSRQS